MKSGQLLDLIKREEDKIVDFRHKTRSLSGSVRREVVTLDRDADLQTFWPSDPAPVLFRGQTAIYEPCVSTIVRGLPLDWRDYAARDVTQFILSHIRSAWFVEHLRHHPFGRWAMDQSIGINTVAVAQHYGLDTHYIDVTESPSVAAFFATCRIVKGNNPGEVVCTPIDHGTGIFYRVRWHNLPFRSCRPIGLQPFPRPREQSAWTYELWHGEDFQNPRCEQSPCVESVLFEHSLSLSQHFLRIFDNGSALFPADVMAEVADMIRTSSFVPADIARLVIDAMSNDPDWRSKLPAVPAFEDILRDQFRCDLKEGVLLLFTEEQKKRIADADSQM